MTTPGTPADMLSLLRAIDTRLSRLEHVRRGSADGGVLMVPGDGVWALEFEPGVFSGPPLLEVTVATTGGGHQYGTDGTRPDGFLNGFFPHANAVSTIASNVSAHGRTGLWRVTMPAWFVDGGGDVHTSGWAAVVVPGRTLSPEQPVVVEFDALVPVGGVAVVFGGIGFTSEYLDEQTVPADGQWHHVEVAVRSSASGGVVVWCWRDDWWNNASATDVLVGPMATTAYPSGGATPAAVVVGVTERFGYVKVTGMGGAGLVHWRASAF